MNVTDSLGVVGAVASIVALSLTLGAVALKFAKTYRQSRKDAERMLQDQLSRYEKSANTLGARTDLGFFMLNMLGQYRSNTIYFSIFVGVYSFYIGIFLIVLLVSKSTAIEWIALASMVLYMIMTFKNLRLMLRNIELEGKYHNQFAAIWERPIQKRFDRADTREEGV